MLLVIYKLPLWIVFSIIIGVLLFWAYFNERSKNDTRRIWKIINIALLAISLYYILQATLLSRSVTERILHLEPFRLFSLASNDPEMYRSMLMNVLLFIPLGVSLVSILPQKYNLLARVFSTFLLGFSLSITVEVLQYAFSLGEADIDDVICNSFGALLGASILLLGKAYERLKRSHFYNKKLILYTFITFSVSWSAWAFLSYFTTHGIFSFSHPISVVLHLIGGMGPFLSSIVLTERSEKRWFIRILFYKKPKTYKYLALFAVVEIAIFAFSSMTLNPTLHIYAIPIIFLQAATIYGGFEEYGWRGKMQPMLEKDVHFPFSAIIVGAIWSVWHLPLWYVTGATQQTIPFYLFAILGILLSIWFAALYKKTESAFYCALLHGLTNTLLSVFVIYINWILIVGLLILTILSIIIYRKCN